MNAQSNATVGLLFRTSPLPGTVRLAATKGANKGANAQQSATFA
jgi:hypothetical protein